MSYRLRSSQPSAAAGPICGVGTDAPRSSVLGYAVVTYDEDVKPPTVLSAKRWLAPELGCFPLREEFLFASGPAGAATRAVREAVFVIPGEPSPALFEIPAGYRERSPSELAAEFAHRFHGREAWPGQTSSTLEQIYQSSNGRR